MLGICFSDLKETCCQLIGAKRVEGKDVIVIGPGHINERMEAYISFIKDNGKAVSNSVHAGSLNTDVLLEVKMDSVQKQHHLTKKEPALPEPSGEVEPACIAINPDFGGLHDLYTPT